MQWLAYDDKWPCNAMFYRITLLSDRCYPIATVTIYIMREVWDNIHLSHMEPLDITIYTGETSDIRRGEAESDIILARL